MRNSVRMLAAVAVALAAPAIAQPAKAVDPAGTGLGDLQPMLQQALDRGALLYIYDEAAWHGTDDLRDHFPELMKLANGYVVSGSQAETELVFYDETKSKAVYRATYRYEKLAASGAPSPDRAALTPLEKRLIAAREQSLKAFIAANVTLCTKGKANLAVLPPARTGDPAIAYLMSSRVVMEELPLGGHYSVTVDADGKTGAVRKFTNGCANMPLNQPKEGKIAGLTITHLLDPVPTEIHVFSSMTAHLPVYVATISNGRLWQVNGSKIEFVQDMKK
jgi:hypothetical protein